MVTSFPAPNLSLQEQRKTVLKTFKVRPSKDGLPVYTDPSHVEGRERAGAAVENGIYVSSELHQSTIIVFSEIWLSQPATSSTSVDMKGHSSREHCGVVKCGGWIIRLQTTTSSRCPLHLTSSFSQASHRHRSCLLKSSPAWPSSTETILELCSNVNCLFILLKKNV